MVDPESQVGLQEVVALPIDLEMNWTFSFQSWSESLTLCEMFMSGRWVLFEEPVQQFHRELGGVRRVVVLGRGGGLWSGSQVERPCCSIVLQAQSGSESARPADTKSWLFAPESGKGGGQRKSPEIQEFWDLLTQARGKRKWTYLRLCWFFHQFSWFQMLYASTCVQAIGAWWHGKWS